MKKLSPNLKRLLSILNDGQFHDDKSLSISLNITQVTIKKLRENLENYDVRFDLLEEDKYRLHEPYILLDEETLNAFPENKNIRIGVLESIDSTNSYLKSMASSDQTQICIAEYQTLGRGRLGNNWRGPFGKNLYFSIAYSLNKNLKDLSGLSLIMSLAVVKILNKYIDGSPLMIKWPNDIYFNDLKLAGILVEIKTQLHGFTRVIIGIGINVNMSAHDLDDTSWSSILKITDKYIDRNILIRRIIDSVICYLESATRYNLNNFFDEWHEVDYLKNHKITLNLHGKKVIGIASGINEVGHLVLTHPDGTVEAFSSGDASLVRKAC